MLRETLGDTQTFEVVSGTITATGFTSPIILVDGVVTSTITTARSHVTITTATAFDADAIQVGQDDSFGQFKMEELKMWNSVLNTQEALDYTNNATYHYPNSAIVQQTMLAKDFDPTNTLIKDVSGLGNDFTINGATKRQNRGFDVDGSGDFFSLADNTSIDLDQEFAIAMLFKINTGGSTKNFFHKRDGSNEGIVIDMDASGTGIRVILEDADTNQVVLSFTRNIVDRKYHTFVVARDSGDNVRLYFDGVLEESGSTTFTATMNNTIRATIAANNSGTAAIIGEVLQFLWVQGRPMTNLQAHDFHVNAIKSINQT